MTKQNNFKHVKTEGVVFLCYFNIYIISSFISISIAKQIPQNKSEKWLNPKVKEAN